MSQRIDSIRHIHKRECNLCGIHNDLGSCTDNSIAVLLQCQPGIEKCFSVAFHWFEDFCTMFHFAIQNMPYENIFMLHHNLSYRFNLWAETLVLLNLWVFSHDFNWFAVSFWYLFKTWPLCFMGSFCFLFLDSWCTEFLSWNLIDFKDSVISYSDLS